MDLKLKNCISLQVLDKSVRVWRTAQQNKVYTDKRWPAQYVMTSQMENFNTLILSLAGSKIHKGIEVGNNGMSPHDCRIKWGMLYDASLFKHAGVLASKSKRVCVCVCGFPLTFTVLFWAALDHWNVLHHQKKTDTSKQRVFAKLWEMLSGDLVTFVMLRGPQEERERDGRSAPL